MYDTLRIIIRKKSYFKSTGDFSFSHGARGERPLCADYCLRIGLGPHRVALDTAVNCLRRESISIPTLSCTLSPPFVAFDCMPSPSQPPTNASEPMETVVHIELTPDADAKLTPLELLEDFADASRDWQYLEDESVHYAEIKHRPACILRHRYTGTTRYVDFGFAAANPADANDIELIILDTPSAQDALTLKERNAVVDGFIQHMQQYLGGRPGHASLRVEKEDVDPAAAPAKPSA